MRPCMCIGTCIRIYTSKLDFSRLYVIHTYMYMYVYMRTYMYMYMRMHVCVCVHACTLSTPKCICMYVYMCMYMYTHMFARMYVRICMYACMYVLSHTWTGLHRFQKLILYIQNCVYICVRKQSICMYKL